MDQSPWLVEGRFTSEQLSSLLDEHIQTVVSHYRGQVFAWDVVNEAFDEHGALKDSIWYNRPGIGLAAKGTAYVEHAFQLAHATDPAALLFYNDAEAESVNPKSEAIFNMIKDFRHRGIPIDGVGLQMHLFDLNPDLASIEANIARFTALGVQVHITEMDVAIPTDPNGDALHPADLQKQADIYAAVARACLSHPGCTAIQTWGFTDKYSWIRSRTKRRERRRPPLRSQLRPQARLQRPEASARRSDTTQVAPTSPAQALLSARPFFALFALKAFLRALCESSARSAVKGFPPMV